MGRTLHFTIIESNKLTGEQLEKIEKISEFFNSGEFENAWTCENFWVSRETLNNSIIDGWGFVKTQGNEFNSFLVYKALLEISKRIPNEIELRDEGEFLVAPLIIKGGKSKLDIQQMLDDIYWWLTPKPQHENQREKFKGYAESYINLLKKYGEKYQRPETFNRPIKAEDFKNFKTKNIMDGFYGEYWRGETEESIEGKEWSRNLTMRLQQEFGEDNVLTETSIPKTQENL